MSTTEDVQPDVPKKKENPVFSESSLQALGRELSNAEKALVVAMLLNIPTTLLVSLQLEGGQTQRSPQDQAVEFLRKWKELKNSAKDKEKLRDLDSALKGAGLVEIADAVADRAANKEELSADAFASA